MVDRVKVQGNFLTPVNIESALFFESAEEIFRRVHREIRPRTPSPSIEIEYKRFANANSDVRLESGAIRVRITPGCHCGTLRTGAADSGIPHVRCGADGEWCLERNGAQYHDC